MEAVEEVEESKDAEGEAKDEEKTGEPVEGEVTYGELLEGGGVIGWGGGGGGGGDWYGESAAKASVIHKHEKKIDYEIWNMKKL